MIAHLMGVACAVSLASAMPILPLYVVDAGYPRSFVGVMNLVHNVTQLVARPVGGSLADAYGPKKLASLGALGYALSDLLALVPHPAALLASRASLGLGMGALWPPLLSTVAESGRSLGVFNAVTQLPMVFGPYLGGYLYRSTGPLTFALLALPALLAAPLAVLLPDVRASRDERVSPLEAIKRTVEVDRRVFTASLPSFAVMSVQPTVESFVPLLLKKLGADPAQIGLILAIRNAVAVTLQAPSGWLADRYSPAALAAMGCVLAALGVIILPAVKSVPVAVALLCVGGMGYSLSQPSSLKLVAEVSGEKRGLGMGWWGLIMSLGRIAGSFPGLLADVSLDAVFYLSGAIPLTTVPALLRTRRSPSGETERR
ncbi:MFS transporter [Methanopyrus sp.]